MGYSVYSGFQLVSILFPLFWLLFFGVLIFMLVKTFSNNRKNDNSPVLTTPATVVTKRTHVWGDHAHTNYYVTFQVPSGDRMELEIPQDRFGYLVEGDQGDLTFQGTRFLRFQRTGFPTQ